MTKFKSRRPEEVGNNRRIHGTLSSRTAPLTDAGGNEHMIIVDASHSPGYPLGGADEKKESRDDLPFDSRTIGVSTITSVRQLQHLVTHILSSPSNTPNGPANHRYYNLYHKATDNVQIGLLRALTINHLQQSLNETYDATSLLNVLNHSYAISEQVFQQPLTATPNEVQQIIPSSQTMDANECTEIMQQFFQIFIPTMTLPALSTSERTEIINDFYQFLVMYDYSWDRIPYSAFVQWFRMIMEKTVKYKLVLQYGGGSNGSSNGHSNGGGSGNGSEDGKGGGSEGSSGSSRGRYQYQLNYQRIQRTAMTDTNRLTEGLKTGTSDDDDSAPNLSTPVIRAGKHHTPGSGAAQKESGGEKRGSIFSSPRRVTEGSNNNNSNPDQFSGNNPLRESDANNQTNKYKK